ncbi:hypothetical protein LEMLEM_LOCUS8216 [Lemmus lemmus]
MLIPKINGGWMLDSGERMPACSFLKTVLGRKRPSIIW